MRPRCAAWPGRLAWAWCALALVLVAQGAAAAASAPLRWQQAILEVCVNGQSPGPLLVALVDARGGVWIEPTDFAQLRLRAPAAGAHEYEGRAYLPLEAIRGSEIRLDEAHQRVLVQVPADAFDSSRLTAASRPSTPLTRAAPGAFLDYQLSAQHIEGQSEQGALAEAGLFGPAGVLTDTSLLRSINGRAQAVRLATTVTHDLPGRLETLTLGDSVSVPGSWSEALRFAGLHWGSNFAMRPDLITTPLLSASGTAVVPSTVDVLVNNQRVSTAQVAAGPFLITSVPPLSGAGQVSVVVRDALGRTRVITQSFYSSPLLLAPGLSEYSVDLGPVRENYALASDDYGALLGSMTYRRGISDALTLEGHAEFLGHGAHAAGIDSALRLGTAGILTLTLAQGGEAHHSGVLGGVGFERSASFLSFTASTLFASAGFRRVGDTPLAGEPFREQTLLQAGVNLERAGSLSLAYVLETYASEPRVQTVSGSYNVSLGALGTINLVLTHSTGANGSTAAFLSLTHTFGERTAGTLAAQAGSGPGAPPRAALIEYQENPPVGPGTGYRLIGATSGDYDADWRGRFDAADIELEAARSLGITGRSALAQGTLTFLDGELHAGRASPGSFAIVEVGGLADVPVYVDNQLVARTDGKGQVLLPDLPPYVASHVSIDPKTLPLATEIGAGEMTIAPPYESGVIVRFPVKQTRAGVFRLVTASGEPVPVGAQVLLRGKSFPVALEGMTYVTGYDQGMSATARWDGHACRFRLRSPPPGDPLPDMGTIVCRRYPQHPASSP